MENVDGAMPGRGSVDQSSRRASEADGDTGAAGMLRLLLVEDDPGDARLAQVLLSRAGVEAEWTVAGRLTDVDFDAAARSADCALVDLGLPDSQGLDAVSEFVAHAPSLPVVVVSGNTDRALALRAVAEGAQDYLVKGRTDADLMAKTIRYAIERKKIDYQLQQAQQLARLGRLTGGIAHHFNNMFMVITNYAEFVASALEVVPGGDANRWQETRRDVEQIQWEVRRAADLTRQLMIFGDQDVARAEVLQLNNILEASRDRLETRLGNQITLDISRTPRLRPFLADPGHIGLLLDCLADNARDAMTEGGRLLISTANTESGGEASEPRRTWVRLQISDTGPGISAGVLGDIFDPFFTTKPPGQGTGMGLAVVHAIVTRWGGQLDVSSPPGAGATFTISFPAIPETA